MLSLFFMALAFLVGLALPQPEWAEKLLGTEKLAPYREAIRKILKKQEKESDDFPSE